MRFEVTDGNSDKILKIDDNKTDKTEVTVDDKADVVVDMKEEVTDNKADVILNMREGCYCSH